MRRLIALLLPLLLLTGCVPERETDENGQSWEQYIQDQSQEDTAPDYPASFSLAYHKDHTLDPITCGEGIQQDVASLLYEPLFQLDETFSPVPLLCESYSWDESYLTCTLTLRQDALFQDGSSLTASDVAATLRRAMASQRYGYRLRQVASITATRGGQVIITLTQPNSGFVALLDIPIVKSGTESLAVPVGTGPYLFVTGSSSTYLTANHEWWQGKPLPVSTIPLVHAKDQDTAAHLFASHRVELLSVDPTGDLASAVRQADSTDVATAVLQYVGFNTTSGVFADPAARQAFSLGIQRETLASTFLSGHAQPAQFPISPNSSLYPADLERPYSHEAFLTALAAAGHQTGQEKELRLLVNEENSFRLACAQFLAESLSQGDWLITVTAKPWEEYLAALAAGEFDLYYGQVRLTADWDMTDLVGTSGSLNYGAYTDESTDALLAALSSSSNRQAAAERLCARLAEETPIAPVCFQSTTVLTHTGVVEGLSPVAGSTFRHLENWTIHLAE